MMTGSSQEVMTHDPIRKSNFFLSALRLRPRLGW
jgi:hypothetical protein